MSKLLERCLFLIAGFFLGAFFVAQMNFQMVSDNFERNHAKEAASLKKTQMEIKSLLKEPGATLQTQQEVTGRDSHTDGSESHHEDHQASDEDHGHLHSNGPGVHDHHAMANQMDELESEPVSVEQEAFQNQMRNVIDLSYRIVTTKPDSDNPVSWEDAEYFVNHTLGNSALDTLDMDEVQRIAVGLNTQKKRHEFYNLLLNKIAPEGMSFEPAVTYSN